VALARWICGIVVVDPRSSRGGFAGIDQFEAGALLYTVPFGERLAAVPLSALWAA
jgi:hypothetical protein